MRRPDRGRRARSSSARSCGRTWRKAIEQLPERERQILALYYEEELTLAEIGEVIGVGESRVSQLRSLALSRLRTLLRESLGAGAARVVSRILSQEEIDALVAATSGRSRAEDPRAPASADSVLTYNFRRPDRVSKEQLRSLHFLHDRFARNLSTSLSAFLRAMTDVSIVSVEQFAYSEFLMSLPDPTAFYAVAMPPLDGVGALEMNPSVAFAMVDRMLGGSGETPAPNRALTEIEQNVARRGRQADARAPDRDVARDHRRALPDPGPRDAAADAAGDRAERSRHPARVRHHASATSRGMLSISHSGRGDRDDGREGRAGVAADAPPADGARRGAAAREPRPRAAAGDRAARDARSARASCWRCSPATW